MDQGSFEDETASRCLAPGRADFAAEFAKLAREPGSKPVAVGAVEVVDPAGSENGPTQQSGSSGTQK